MSSFRLPSSGDSNWGQVLNAYIENLENKIKSLETKYVSLEQESAIKNIGYASSGIVGVANIDYDPDSKIVSFSGNVFISGDINTYYSLENIHTNSLESLLPNYSYYVFLKYVGEGQPFEILLQENNFQANYTTILIGFIYKKVNGDISFIRYYHSSLKTLMETQYELNSRWADLEAHNSYFTITIGINEEGKSTDRVPTSLTCGDFDLYCSGLSENSISKFYTQNASTNSIVVKPQGKIIKLVDSLDEENGRKLITNIRNSFDTTKGNYYRILLDVFGNIIVQRAYTTEALQGDGLLREQHLLNTRFNNIMPEGLRANLWVEVARFGFNLVEITTGIYSQDPSNTSAEFNTFERMTFVKSITNGLAAQQSPRIWVTKDSEIDLSKTSFKDSVYSNNPGFKLEYRSGSTDQVTPIKLDTITTSYQESEDIKLLFTKSTENVTFGNITLAENSQIFFSSDRRRKENFSPISDSYLEVVNNVPVMNYNYKNSIIPQVGIMAQDLEDTNISNIDCFVTIEDSFELKNKRSLYETKLVYILWKALQEETELRKKLEKRVEDLEAK